MSGDIAELILSVDGRWDGRGGGMGEGEAMVWSLARIDFLIGIAGAEALNESSDAGVGSSDRWTGLATDEGKMKSSRFIVSWVGW
jgi:hypothetical protein